MARAIRAFFLENENEGVEEPLIFCVTAYSEATFKREAFKAGMDLFLSKPLSDYDLSNCLQEHF